MGDKSAFRDLRVSIQTMLTIVVSIVSCERSFSDWVNQKQTRPPTLLLGLSLEEPETIFIKKEGN